MIPSLDHGNIMTTTTRQQSSPSPSAAGSASRKLLIDGHEVQRPRYVAWFDARNCWAYRPTEKMKRQGFRFVSFGAEMTAADLARVNELNAEWDKRDEPEGRPGRWPQGSVGWVYDDFMVTRAAGYAAVGKTVPPEWKDDWVRTWKWIGPTFGARHPKTVTDLELIEFQQRVYKESGSLRTTARCIDYWFSIRARCAAKGLCFPLEEGVRRNFPVLRPEPRYQRWGYEEVDRMISVARDMGYHAMSVMIAVAYDSSLSPVDIRKLRVSMLNFDEGRQVYYFDTKRSKTGVKAIGTITPPTLEMLREYYATLGRNGSEDGLIFHTPPSRQVLRQKLERDNPKLTPYTQARIVAHFGIIRGAAFGDVEMRRFSDLRRSGAVEAEAGGAPLEAIGGKLANGVANNPALKAVYMPPQRVKQLEQAAVVDAAREKGRALLKAGKPTGIVSGGALLLRKVIGR